VDHAGTPKLLDFGIAKLLNADAGDALTRRTERIMTPEYASPEQMRGEQVTTAADVYTLGVLLFELLAGKRPFQLDAKSPLEVIRVISEERPRAPSSIRSIAVSGEPHSPVRLNRDLDNIVLMAMRKEPSQRYPGISHRWWEIFMRICQDTRCRREPIAGVIDRRSSSVVTRRA
jgi:serine/threonine protein kinase